MVSFENRGIKGYMRICIDDIIHARPAGTIYSFYFTDGVPFDGIDNIVFGVDKICCALDFPRAEFNARTLFEQTEETREDQMILKALDTPCFCEHYGKLTTISVIVMFRRNGGLQGEIRVRESKFQHRKHFRSGLELMYFLQEICVRLGSYKAKRMSNYMCAGQEGML